MAEHKPAEWARQYCSRLNWALVPIPEGTKAPTYKGWNKNYITDPEKAFKYWSENPRANMGVVLEPSKLVTLDVDNVEYTRAVFESYGINLDSLKENAPCVVGNPARFRLIYKLPEGMTLKTHKLTWPDPEHPDDKRRRVVVFELRAGAVQDVLPPSIHPDTKKPYYWYKKPSFVPVLPDELMPFVREWAAFNRDAQKLCAWIKPEKPPELAPKKDDSGRQFHDNGGVIEEFNARHTATAIIESHNYKKIGARWLSPTSESKLAGITETDGKIYSHHASDPLNNGHMRDAFDCFTELEHGGNTRDAVRAAAELLGLNDTTRKRHKQTRNLSVAIDNTQTAITETDGNAARELEYIPDRFFLPQLIRDKLLINSAGEPKKLLANVAIVLRLHPDFEGVLSWDSFALKTVMKKAAPWEQIKGFVQRPWENTDDLKLTEWLQQGGLQVGIDLAQQGAELIAHENQHHPVQDYLNALHWDSIPRVSRWLHEGCGAKLDDYTKTVGTKWLVSAVARVMAAGCQADSALILEGPQGAGKSTTFRILGGEFFTDDMPELHGKDAAQAAAGVWIVELAELDALSRSEASAVKAFITRRVDRYRPPYGRRQIEAPRQCVFAGTINPDGTGYLKDSTGNRRFWPVTIGEMQTEWLEENRNQLWAEAYNMYKRGEVWHLDENETTTAHGESKKRLVVDQWHDYVIRYIDQKPTRDKFGNLDHWAERTDPLTELTINDILENAIGLKPTQINRGNQMRISTILQQLEYKQTKRNNVRIYEVKKSI